jgi:hypothetical protein
MELFRRRFNHGQQLGVLTACNYAPGQVVL